MDKPEVQSQTVASTAGIAARTSGIPARSLFLRGSGKQRRPIARMVLFLNLDFRNQQCRGAGGNWNLDRIPRRK